MTLSTLGSRPHVPPVKTSLEILRHRAQSALAEQLIGAQIAGRSERRTVDSDVPGAASPPVGGRLNDLVISYGRCTALVFEPKRELRRTESEWPQLSDCDARGLAPAEAFT